jgi:hypothetical protein
MKTTETYITQARFESEPDSWHDGYYGTHKTLEEAEKSIQSMTKRSKENDEMIYKCFKDRVLERRIIKRTTTVNISELVIATYK